MIPLLDALWLVFVLGSGPLLLCGLPMLWRRRPRREWSLVAAGLYHVHGGSEFVRWTAGGWKVTTTGKCYRTLRLAKIAAERARQW